MTVTLKKQNALLSKTKTKAKPKPVVNDFILKIAQQCKIEPEQIEDIYPCSSLQHGLFTMSAMGNGSYTAQHCFALPPKTDVKRLQKAWELVISRNAILRTCIVPSGSGAVQVVLRSWTPTWNDCTDYDAYLSDDQQRSFEPGSVLSRFAISSEHMVWTAHHATYDGRTLDIVVEDVVTAYHNQPVQPRKPYRDFIKQMIAPGTAEKAHTFWENALKDRQITHFPSLSSEQGSRISGSHQLTAPVPKRSSLGVTSATIVQAAWALTLSSQLSVNTVSWGTTASGRDADLDGIEHVVGPTLATVPFCIDLDRSQSVKAYLEKVQEHLADVGTHRNFGLQNIKNLGPEAELACKFQTLFVYGGTLSHEEAEESIFMPMQLEKGKQTIKFFNYPLVILCNMFTDNTLRAQVDFDANVIGPERVQGLVEQLEHICRLLLTCTGDETIGELPLVSPQDMQRILATDRPFSEPLELPLDHIASFFKSQPQAPAVESWDGSLTYAQLDTLSSNLAGKLIADHSLRAEDIVPICMDKSSTLVVAVIAVLKTGAAFVLLDPAWPQQRLLDVVEQTSPKTIITSHARESLFNSANIRLALVDSAHYKAPATSDETRALNRVTRSTGDAMYLVFTSGSTGKPKGAIVNNGSFFTSSIGSKTGYVKCYKFDSDSRVLHFSSPAFDVAVMELVAPLMAGSCICVPSETDRLVDLAKAMSTMKVNFACLTSTTARQLRVEEVPTLRILALTGEPMAKDQQQYWADKVCLLNVYGPCECTVHSSVAYDISQKSNSANIGPFVVGTGWIVNPNDHNRLVPTGATGELLIDGPHVGRGYLKNPTITKAAFIANPSWLPSKTFGVRRLYKTGDLVRYDTDGSFIYEGRKDRQVKLYGQRIEVADIEFHISKALPKATAVAVELFKSGDQQQLVCFVFHDRPSEDLLSQLSHQGVANTQDLRTALSNVLPRHCLPSRYIAGLKQPTLPSGKLNRRALQDELCSPSGAFTEISSKDEARALLSSDNRVACELADWMRTTLKAKQGNAVASQQPHHDELVTSLGLDSIHMISLLTYCRRQYGVKLAIDTLYDDTLCLSGLASIIEDLQRNGSEQSLPGKLSLQSELESALVSLTNRAGWNGRSVFLTGGSGYLGSQVLRKLLQDVRVARIILHVRASSASVAMDRVVAAAKLSGWWSADYTKRIECWPGDLALPQLGLAQEQWQRLNGIGPHDQLVHDVIHCGATVQWQAPFAALKAANVQSTADLLQAVSQWQHKGSFIYVSGGQRRTVNDKVETLYDSLKEANGYSQTKFVADELVSRFAQLQVDGRIRFSIVRPGWIIGTETESVPNADDFTWKVVQACALLKAHPVNNQDLWLQVATSSEVADTILSAAFDAPQVAANNAVVQSVDTGISVNTFWQTVQKALQLKTFPAVDGQLLSEQLTRFEATSKEKHNFTALLSMVGGSANIGSDVPANERVERPDVCKALEGNLKTLQKCGFFSEAVGSNGVDGPLQAFTRSGLTAKYT